MVEHDQPRPEDDLAHHAADPVALGIEPPARAIAVDRAFAGDGDVMGVDGGDQRLAARGLKHGGLRIFGMIGRAQEGCTRGHIQGDIAFQGDRRADIGAFGERDGAPTFGGAVVNRGLDRLGVFGFPIGAGAELTGVATARRGQGGRCRQQREQGQA